MFFISRLLFFASLQKTTEVHRSSFLIPRSSLMLTKPVDYCIIIRISTRKGRNGDFYGHPRKRKQNGCNARWKIIVFYVGTNDAFHAYAGIL